MSAHVYREAGIDVFGLPVVTDDCEPKHLGCAGTPGAEPIRFIEHYEPMTREVYEDRRAISEAIWDYINGALPIALAGLMLPDDPATFRFPVDPDGNPLPLPPPYRIVRRETPALDEVAAPGPLRDEIASGLRAIADPDGFYPGMRKDGSWWAEASTPTDRSPIDNIAAAVQRIRESG